MTRKRWVAPPGWPAPPEGFAPPAGWAPDPSWPAAPPGWRFWEDEEERVTAARKAAERGRTKLGSGQILPGMGRPARRGHFYIDRQGLFVASGLTGRGDQELLLEWDAVVALNIEGSEKELSRSRSSYRKSFTVRHTRGTTTTATAAMAYIAIGLKDDELVLKINGSPMAARSKLGGVISRLRADGHF